MTSVTSLLAFFIPLAPRAPAVDASVLRYVGRVRTGVRLAAVAGFVLNCQLSYPQLQHAREISKSAATASNISGLLLGMRAYCNDYGDYPSALSDLVRTQVATGSALRSYGDPIDLPESSPTAADYSSFIYQPLIGAWRDEPEVILLHERAPWSRHGDGRLAYTVGFGDGRSAAVLVDEFGAVLWRSECRRREVAKLAAAAQGQATTQPGSGGGG